MKNPDLINYMEIVLEDFQRITFMEYFPNIRKCLMVNSNIL